MSDKTHFKSDRQFKKSIGHATFYGNFDQLIGHIKEQFSSLSFELDFVNESQILLKRNFELSRLFGATGVVKLDFFKYHDRTVVNYTTYSTGGLSIAVFLFTVLYLVSFTLMLLRGLETNQIILGLIPLLVSVSILSYQRISNERRLFEFIVNNLLPEPN